MPDGDAHRLPGTFGPRAMVLQADGDIAVVRWQGLVNVSGRGRAAVQVACKKRVLSVLVEHLVRSAGSGRRGGAGGEIVGEGRVVN
jgi:hypothetical protein